MHGPRDVIVMGASAGGIEPIRQILAALPKDLPASVLLVVHLAPDHPSHLPEILQSTMPASHPEDGEYIRHGRVYVAPPDRHLLLEGQTISVVVAPRENRARPAIDALFRSAAYTAGNRVIGVLLSGTLEDGAAGLWMVGHRGGVTVVQDPKDATYREMPENAIAQVAVDHVIPAAQIGPLLGQLVRGG